MGLELYQKESVFRQEIDHCLEVLESFTKYSWISNLKEVLYPGDNVEKAEKLINQQDIVQPIIFIFEYALAKLLMNWGIKPHAMIGYSIGEYVAATLAGVITLEDAIKLIVLRGELMRNLPVGVMLSVPMSEKELLPLLNDELSLAVVNGPSCIVAGTHEAIETFEKVMKERKILCMRLSIPTAGHSKIMDSILKDYEEEVSKINLNKPEIPYISNLTGKWITIEAASDPKYWAQHIRGTVRFADGLKELLTIENSIFLEVGPGRDLSVLVRRYITDKPEERIINVIRHPKKQFPMYIIC